MRAISVKRTSIIMGIIIHQPSKIIHIPKSSAVREIIVKPVVISSCTNRMMYTFLTKPIRS